MFLALIDAVLEGVDDHGESPAVVHARDIGRRVLALYWPQTRPFTVRPARCANPARPATSSTRSPASEAITTSTGWSLSSRPGRRTSSPPSSGTLSRRSCGYPIPLLQKIGAGGRAVEQRFI